MVLPRLSLAEQDFLEQVEREVEVLLERGKEAAVAGQAVVRWIIEIPREPGAVVELAADMPPQPPQPPPRIAMRRLGGGGAVVISVALR